VVRGAARTPQNYKKLPTPQTFLSELRAHRTENVWRKGNFLQKVVGFMNISIPLSKFFAIFVR
jgi:hypothetical protein